MLAYCTALRAPVAWLIYAQGAGGMVRRRVRHAEIEIVQYPLDLALPPRALLAQVAELARLAVPQRALAKSANGTWGCS
jgi:5-methylcytosine-specific restriction enzyme subunit McrC